MIRELIDCWAVVAQGLWAVGKALLPFLAAYGILYAVTAAIFLLSLRVRSVDGKLRVAKSSTTYFLAHPLIKYYGLGASTGSLVNGEYIRKPSYPDAGNICGFYIRLFNMVLFVWPFLLLFLALATVIGSVGTFLVTGRVLVPDFSTDGFMRPKDVFVVRGRTLPFIAVAAPLTLLVLAIVKFSALLSVLGVLAMIIACLLPFLLVVALGVITVRRVHKAQPGDDSAVSAVKEVMVAKKARWCKLVEFK